MKKVAVFTNNKLMQYRINLIFSKENYEISYLTYSIDEALARLASLSFEIVVVDSAFLQGRSQFLDILVNIRKCFVIYVSQRKEEGILYNVYKEINFLAIKEENINTISDILVYFYKADERIKLLENKNRLLEEKLDEIENIRLAKVYLMKQGYTEPDAHKYITKKAMELRKTKGQVAKMIRERVI